MIQIKENSILAHLAAKKLRADKVAMVIGNTVCLHNTTKEEFLRNTRWVKHEMAHVEQYRRHGIFKFLLLYSWYSIKYGYTNNPFEIEAREKEKSL
jgi:hypothetical protein